MSVTVLGIVAGSVAAVYAMGKLSDAVTALLRSWIPVVLAFHDLCHAVREGGVSNQTTNAEESTITPGTSAGHL